MIGCSFSAPHVGAPTRSCGEPGGGLYGGSVHLYREAAAVLLCRIVPKWLSTEVFHSVENLHACVIYGGGIELAKC